jgi:DUF4097 and DUF4098 domain-containing protein YvlB
MRVPLTVVLLAACTSAAQADAPRSWKFATGPSADVTVENVSGKIEVKAIAGNEVQVDAVVVGGTEADRARWAVEAQGSGPTVKVRARCGEDGHGCNSRAHVEITVKAPAGSRLSAHGVSSDLTVAGVTGDLRAETTSGDVRVAGGRTVSIRTVSGNVHLDGASDATIQSVSGDMVLRGVQRESRLNSVSGDMTWEGGCAAGCRFNAETVSGDLRLRLDPASSFELEFRSRSGDLDDGFAGTERQRPRHDGLRTRIGKGEGAVAFHSVSGDLRLEKR